MGTIPKYLDSFDMDFFLIAMRYTLLEQDVLDAEFPACARRGVGIVIGGGLQFRHHWRPAPSRMRATIMRRRGRRFWRRVARMEAVCRRHNAPLPAAALQFPLGHPIVASIIPGAIAAREVAENVANFRREIPADLWAELKHEKLIRADAPVPTK